MLPKDLLLRKLLARTNCELKDKTPSLTLGKVTVAVQAVLLVDRFPEWHVLVKAGTIPPTLADAYRNVGMCAGADSQVCTSEVLSRERGHDKKVLARLRATQVFLDSDVRSADLPLPPLVAPTGVT